jgi:FtsH-binding integral membrane protein
MILKIVVCAVMVLQTLRRSNESRLFNRTVQLCLSVLLLAEEVMRVFNIYKYWLRILILICVLGCWLFVPSQTRKESVVYVYFLIAIFGGPSGYVLLFLQLFLQ